MLTKYIFTIWLFLISVTTDNVSITCGSRYNKCFDFVCTSWCKVIGNNGGVCLTHPEPAQKTYKKGKLPFLRFF